MFSFMDNEHVVKDFRMMSWMVGLLIVDWMH